MQRRADADWVTLLHFQHGVAARPQARDAGFSRRTVQRRLRSGTWQRVQRGVYATFTGEPSREALLRAAVLRAGKGAMLSHETAAEIQGLVDKPSSRIHVTVPSRRRPAQRRKIPGVVIHRSDQSRGDPQPDWKLPRTQIDDTVLDLVAAARNFDDAYAWISRATARWLTTPGSLRETLAVRKKVRWRAWLAEALDDADEGINSALERRYVHGVERAHGLPKARRQARRNPAARTQYLDNYYERYRLCVELDGQASHPREQRRQDSRRDNDNLVADDTATLRYGWPDATVYRCDSAIQLATILRRRGWDGDTFRPCGPGCPVSRPVRGSKGTDIGAL